MALKEYAVGIDLGGTFVKYSLISNKGEIVFSSKLPTEADVSKERVIDNISRACQLVIDYADENMIMVKAIGIGTPGIVDTDSGVVLGGAENIVDWENIELKDILMRRHKLPVYVDNDANLMGLGESIFGAGNNAEHCVFLTVGTGIGGAVIINGELFGGRNNRGTELGHIPLFVDGDKCGCGATGCLEEYASVTGLIKRHLKRIEGKEHSYPESIDGEVIMEFYANNDPYAIESVNEHCEFIGRGAAAFINIFSPEKVIIGGGISEAGEFYIEKIRKAAFGSAIDDCTNNVEIVAAKLGNKAGSMGAACLCFK